MNNENLKIALVDGGAGASALDDFENWVNGKFVTLLGRRRHT